MRRIRARDAEALHEASQQFGHTPFRIACRMLGDADEAQDIAQEAMLRLWQYADRWNEGGPGINAWLSRVSTNLCLDRLRKRRRVAEEEVPETADDAPLVDRRMETDQVRQAVVDCIGDLPDRQRASIILTYYEQIPNQEAAGNLSMNIKAFESMLHRARNALKTCFDRKGVAAVDIGGMVR